MATITFVYDHHVPDLARKLVHIQHDFQRAHHGRDACIWTMTIALRCSWRGARAPPSAKSPTRCSSVKGVQARQTDDDDDRQKACGEPSVTGALHPHRRARDCPLDGAVWRRSGRALELEVSEIEVVADRPVAASSQQSIPDNEYLMQPQGRPACMFAADPRLYRRSIRAGSRKRPTSISCGDSTPTTEPTSRILCRWDADQFRSHAHGQGLYRPTFTSFPKPSKADVTKAPPAGVRRFSPRRARSTSARGKW